MKQCPLASVGIKAVLPIFLIMFPVSLFVSVVLKWIPGVDEKWSKRVISGPLALGMGMLTSCGIGGYLMLLGVNDLQTRCLIYGSVFMTTIGSVGLFVSHHEEAYNKSTFWRNIAVIAIGNIGVAIGLIKFSLGSWEPARDKLARGS